MAALFWSSSRVPSLTIICLVSGYPALSGQKKGEANLWCVVHTVISGLYCLVSTQIPGFEEITTKRLASLHWSWGHSGLVLGTDCFCSNLFVLGAIYSPQLYSACICGNVYLPWGFHMESVHIPQCDVHSHVQPSSAWLHNATVSWSGSTVVPASDTVIFNISLVLSFIKLYPWAQLQDLCVLMNDKVFKLSSAWLWKIFAFFGLWKAIKVLHIKVTYPVCSFKVVQVRQTVCGLTIFTWSLLSQNLYRERESNNSI